MELVCGIDVGSYKTGIVYLNLDGSIYSKSLISSTLKTPQERIRSIATVVNVSLDAHRPVLVALEKQIYVQNPLTTLMLGEMLGIFQWLCWSYGVDTCVVENTRWKKVVLGNGKLGKTEILEMAQNIWPNDDFEAQDTADAACIALYGIYQLSISKENK